MVKIFDFHIFQAAQKNAKSRAHDLVSFLLRKEKENGNVEESPLTDDFIKDVQKVFYESERYLQENKGDAFRNKNEES